jgi:hypothetical protein
MASAAQLGPCLLPKPCCHACSLHCTCRYVTEGMEEVVARLEPGDVIVSARVVSGADKLLLPGS